MAISSARDSASSQPQIVTSSHVGSDKFVHLPPYQPPTTYLFRRLPPSLVPYAELMRLHKPAGYWTFYFPHMYGTLLGALLVRDDTAQTIPPSTLLRLNLIFLLGSIILRGAACTWNDAIDAPLDRQVARCRHRPCARGAVPIQEAYVFTGLQSIVGMLSLTLLPGLCTLYGLPLAILCGAYAFAKRVTNYPQLVLGATLAVGQWVGAAGLGVNPLGRNQAHHWPVIACFYFANVLSAIIVDAIYSHQDLKDDLRAGVKSIAVAWQDSTKPLLWTLTSVQVSLLCVAGLLMRANLGYYLFAVAGIAGMSWSMVWLVELEKPENCWWWFVNSIHWTGLCLGSGLLSVYLF